MFIAKNKNNKILDMVLQTFIKNIFLPVFCSASVRRTSMREKSQISWKEALEEARLRSSAASDDDDDETNEADNNNQNESYEYQSRLNTREVSTMYKSQALFFCSRLLNYTLLIILSSWCHSNKGVLSSGLDSNLKIIIYN